MVYMDSQKKIVYKFILVVADVYKFIPEILSYRFDWYDVFWL